MSTINSNASLSSGVLTILSSSADATTNTTSDTESAGAKLVDIAKNATSGKSGTSSPNPKDTVSLSDDAITYLSSQKSGSTSQSSASSSNSDVYSLLSQIGSDTTSAYDIYSQSYGKDFADAYKNKDLNITNVNEIPGLDYQQHGNGPNKNTGLVYSTTNTAVQAAYEAAHPGSILITDDKTGNAYYVQPKSAAAQASVVAYANAQST